MIRVLIADDSAFMRKVLSDLFTAASDFEVAGTAMNGKEAVEKALKLKPDILTMDVNMPVMDGLQALEVLMKDFPIPVVMLSSLTKEGADATIKALALGAVDFISKTGGSISRIDSIEGEILTKCRTAASANLNVKRGNIGNRTPNAQKKQEEPIFKRINIPVRKKFGVTQPMQNTAVGTRPVLKPHMAASSSFFGSRRQLVAIGTSTGGPRALQAVIPKLPRDLSCGVVVVQHMPAGFTKSLAERLDTLSQVKVKEAEDQEYIKPATVYIAPGNYHMTVALVGGQFKIQLDQNPPVGSHRPAVNVLFDSLAPFGEKLVAVELTGMGCDGAAGMEKIKKNGGYIIAESEETAVVYGMPKAVADLGIADKILPVTQVAGAIVEAVGK